MQNTNGFPMVTFAGGNVSMSDNGRGFDLFLSQKLQAEPLRSALFETATQWANQMTLGRGIPRTEPLGRISCLAVHEDEDVIVRVIAPSDGPVSDEELKSLITLLGVAENEFGNAAASAAG